MSEFEVVGAVSVACVLAAALLAWRLRLSRPDWSDRKRAAVAAVPISAALALMCFWMIADSMWTARYSPEECGVDACGMVMMAASFGLAGVAVAWLSAFAVAAIGLRIFR